MKVVLVSATEIEVQKTLEKFTFWNSLNQIEINHLVTGIGLVATTYTISKFLQSNKPEMMIQAGIAGCFDSKVPLGTTFIVEQDIIADMGVKENNIWKDAYSLGFINQEQLVLKKKYLQNLDFINNNLKIDSVNGISVNEISTEPDFIEAMKQRYNPTTESMEGAAFHYTCIRENIPFLQIRSVSNYIGERDKSKWRFEKSIENLNQCLISIIDQIIKINS